MTTIKLRRGTAAEWTTANPILAAGEMGIETDTRKFKFGDGTTPWNTLAYASAEGGGGTGDGTTLTSIDGTTTYSKLALGNNLVVDTGDIAWTNPQMSSNSQDGYVASASRTETTNYPYRAFDKDTTGQDLCWYTGSVSMPQWIMLECPKPVRLTSCMIMNEVQTPESFKSGYIQGSNDGSTFDTLYTITDRASTAGLQTTYQIDTNNYYKYLRVYCTATSGNGLSIQEIEFSGFTKDASAVPTLNANLDSVTEQIDILKGTKQDILSDGNGTKVVDNKVDIYQGNAGINGLNLYQNNGTITKNDDLSITFNNGACGYIYFPNKGVNNNYEVILHCAYNGTRGGREDSDIHGIRVEPTTNFPNQSNNQGTIWIDVWSSPFRTVIINKDNPQDYSATIPTVNYIKYTIIGTKIRPYYSTDGVDYTSITYNNNLDYVEISESGAYINLCIANRNDSNDINDCWTNTTLYSDSYVLDKTTNTYLMKQGTSNEGVAVATSTKYGLVLPDNSTIVSNNGVISANLPDTSKFLDKTLYSNQTMQGSLTVNGGVTECKKFRMRSSGTGSIDYANTTLGKTMFVFRGVNGDYPILIGDSNQNIQIDSTKVLFNSPTLARKVDDSTEATIIDSSNVSTYATGLAFPSNRYIDLTPGANGTTYTAPADGWIAFAKKLTATGQFVGLSNNTTGMSTMGCNATDGSGGNTSCFIPCKKGDEVVTWYSAGGDVLVLKFIYAEGVQ